MVALSQLTNVHSLADLLDQGHVLPAQEALEMIRQVAVGVAILHRAGKSHGRIVPSAIRLDDRLRPTIDSRRDDGAGDAGDLGGEWVPPGLRDQAFARLMDRLEGSTMVNRGASARSWSDDAGEWTDSKQLDVYGLAAILCRLITGTSADAYLRSPRVKGMVPEGVQWLLAEALGAGESRLCDADDFLAALETSATRPRSGAVTAPPGPPIAALRETDAARPESVLEVCDPTPSCVSGVRVHEPDGDRNASRRDEADLPFRRLGHFDIIARLGQGGMGEVYVGYESSLDRRVAIKVLPAELARDPDLVRRFRAEAAAAARLIHPNIIQIYFIGEDGGHHFFAMQYVDGMSLAQFLARGNRPTVDQSLAIIDEVLSGLVAAHRLGFVHRDIKPANILLDNVHRRALLADFGLVKSLEDSAATRTSAGAVLGTADYMAPEQGLGRVVDFRSDLYSLGVVLFQLLCGRLPFVGHDSTAVIYQHVHESPPPIRELARAIPADLTAIVERLLAKSPYERYQTAADVLADVRALRAGRPLAAGSDRHDARGESAAPPEGTPVARLVDTSPVGHRTTLPELPEYRGDAHGARPDKGRRRVLSALAGAAALPALAGGVWFSLTSPEQRARWFPGWASSAEKPSGEIRLLDGHPSEINGFALTADEERLFVGDRAGKLHVWDFLMGEKRKSLRAHSGAIRRLILSRDGQFVITASADQTLKMWNADTWKQVTQFNGHVDVVTSVALVPGRDEIVSSSFDGTLIRWDMARGSLIARYGSILDENTTPDREIDLTTLDRHVTWVRQVV
ncbi:MAG: protein kinase domain-containing protein, partial [Deltaproteobacteria bacterium]